MLPAPSPYSGEKNTMKSSKLLSAMHVAGWLVATLTLMHSTWDTQSSSTTANHMQITQVGGVTMRCDWQQRRRRRPRLVSRQLLQYSQVSQYQIHPRTNRSLSSLLILLYKNRDVGHSVLNKVPVVPRYHFVKC